MKKTRFFGLVLIIVALFGACKQAPSPGPDTTVNDTYFWAYAGNGKNIIVGIADPASFGYRAAFTPKTGHWYAIWLAAESDIASNPVSMGTISVNGALLSFFPGMGYSGGSFSGTLGGGNLVMQTIPGTSLVNITLEEGESFGFDPADPGGSLPSVPGGGGNSGPSASIGSFKAGKYVMDVAFIDRPTANTAYEGFPVDLTGMTVEITYSNGDKVTKTAANANEFIVDPPVYETANGLHTIQYIAEYNYESDLSSSRTNREFRAPVHKPAQNTFFYEIANLGNELEAAVTGDKDYFEGNPSFDFSGVSIKAAYSTGEKTIIPTAVYKTVFTGESAPNNSVLKVIIGRKYANIPIKHNKVYSISGISLNSQADFSDQVLYDDPRFYSSGAEKHWLSKFTGVSLKLSYKDTAVTKTVNIIKAQSERRLSFVYPENLTQKDPKINIIFHGDSRDFETFQVVPVYNKLVSIYAELLKDPIVLNGSGPLPADNEQSFLKQIKISAIYQMGSDKNKTVKRDNILRYPTVTSGSSYVEVDTYLINALPIETNVNTGAGGILNAANSKAYDEKKKLAKARVTFTTTSVGNITQSTTKTATIDVGVTGY